MEDNNILAVVLAGGKSKRYGEDKNHVKLGNKTLLEHVLFKISNKFQEILIVSNNSLEMKKTKNLTIIPDCLEDIGPLAGVLSSMKWVEENKKPIRDPYLIVKDGQLAGMGAHSYTKGSATGGSEEAAKYKK